MNLPEWTAYYIIDLVFWIWIIKWGGAERLEGSFLSGFFVNVLAPRWNVEGIKLFAWLTLLCSSVWFCIGIFVPSMRFY